MSAAVTNALVTFALAVGDDALILSERTSELMMRAPTLEEELAVANISLDLLGQARHWLTFAAEEERLGRDEDALAYHRNPGDFRHCHIVELPNDDFAFTTLRLLFLSTYMTVLYGLLRESSHPRVAAISAKSYKESVYHLHHAETWMDVLSHSTDESAERLTSALHALSSYVDELIDVSWIPPELIADGTCPDVASLPERWTAAVSPILEASGLSMPDAPWTASGGRSGQFSEHLLEILTRLQSINRAHPGAIW